MKFLRPALFAFLLSFAAHAAEAPAPVGPGVPTARAVYDDAGAFGFCLAEYVYPDQRKFTFALSPNDEINLGLTVPKAGFKPGSKYDLTLTVEKGGTQTVRGTAVESDAMLMQFGKLPAFLLELSKSSKLTVAAGKTVMDFATPGSGAVIKALRECNTENKAKPRPVSAGLPGPLKELLGLAGFTTIKVLPLDKVPPEKRPADFVWRTGHVLGGVRERANPDNKSLEELTGLHLDGLKTKCNGTFKADVEKEVTAPGLRMRKALAQCDQKTPQGMQTVVVAILFYTTAGGRFTTFTHEGGTAEKAETIADRDALYDTLLQLAKEAVPAARPKGPKGK